jgi:hypothetical protein
MGMKELGIEASFTIKDTGKFIGWVCKDINKESVVELEESGLEWKSVASVCSEMARKWFFNKLT